MIPASVLLSSISAARTYQLSGTSIPDDRVDPRWTDYIIQALRQSIDEMDSVDLSADFTALPTSQTARLLSESPLIGRSGHPDLSSSDLFSAHDSPQGDRSQSHAVDDEHEDEVEEGLPEGEEDEGEDEEAQIRRARKAARTREEKLQNDLFLLKKLNSAFSLYTDALRATQSSTEVGRYLTLTTSGLIDRSFLEIKGASERHERAIGPIHRDA